jgi:hypothetical protein
MTELVITLETPQHQRVFLAQPVKEILASQVNADHFPFPCEGDITLAVRNTNYALGPVMLHLVMTPGSVIPARRFTSRLASCTARTAPKRAAKFSCSGRLTLRRR